MGEVLSSGISVAESPWRVTADPCCRGETGDVVKLTEQMLAS